MDSNYYFINQNPYHHNGYFLRQNDTQLTNDIQRAIDGEYSAIGCYEKLAGLAASEEERRQIQEIQQDERRHLDEFSRIYTSLTGRQPNPKIIEECPNTYRAGLEAAFMDEQKTVDFYQDIAGRSQNPYIKEVFRRAAADEQNHAVWFLFFLQRA